MEEKRKKKMGMEVESKPEETTEENSSKAVDVNENEEIKKESVEKKDTSEKKSEKETIEEKK